MPYVFRQGDLPKLDVQVDRGSDFMAWKAQWESYMSLSGLSEESAEKKVQALTLCFSRETLSIVQNLGLSDTDKQDITAIIIAFAVCRALFAITQLLCHVSALLTSACKQA